MATDAGFTGFGDRIGVVDLDGVILSPQPVVGQLKKFGDDSSIKAIILHVNSPGGGVAASEEIYREVKRIREEKKKRIVVSIETVGASGAYYVASASNKIYADSGQHRGVDRRDRGVGELWRSAEVGQAERCCASRPANSKTRAIRPAISLPPSRPTCSR